jgi:uncharacterized membrane protein YuzA (DUF378 family)
MAQPAAPTAVTVKAGDKSATVSFTPPTGTITKYTVTSTPGGIIATGASSPIIVSNLTNGTDYTFAVTATNSAGQTSNPTAASDSIKVNPRNNGVRALFYICLVLVLIGALNWGLVSMNKDYDLVKMLLGDYTMSSRAVYGLVGISALVVLILSTASMSSIYATN